MEIGKTLVLTTKNCCTRNNYISSLENLGKFEFFYGYDKNIDLVNFLENNNKKFLYNPSLKSGILYKGQIGCYIGHYLIIKKIIDEKLENTIVLENDITIDKNDWREYLKNVMEELPKNYDILLLYSRSKNLKKKECRIEEKKFITSYNKTSGAVAYMISLEGAKRLKKKLDSCILKPFDLFIKELAKENRVFNLNTYLFKVNLDFDSTIKTNNSINDINDYYNNHFYKFIKLDQNYIKNVLIITPDELDLNDNIILENLKERLKIYNYNIKTMKAKIYTHKKSRYLELVILFSSIIWPHRRKNISSQARKVANSKIIILNTESYMNARFHKKSYMRITEKSDYILDLFLSNLKFYKGKKKFDYIKFDYSKLKKIEKKQNPEFDILLINGKKKLNIEEFKQMNIKVIEDNIDFDEFNNLLERSKIVIYNSNNLIKFHLIDYLLINKVLFLTNLKIYKFLDVLTEDNLLNLIIKYTSLSKEDSDNIVNKNYDNIIKIIKESKFKFDYLDRFFINDKNKNKKNDYLILELLNYKNNILLDLDNNPKSIVLKGSSIIVGSSGKMTLHESGSLIDGYNNIIRINFSPIEKYEKYVGSRTSIRFIRNNTLRKLNKDIEKFLNDADITIFIGDSRLEKIKHKLDKNKIHLKLNNEYSDLFNNFFNKSLSTGFYTVLISNIFSENKIDLTGFMNLGEINGKCMYHYWEHLNGRQQSYIGKNTNHHFYDESKIINELTNVLF